MGASLRADGMLDFGSRVAVIDADVEYGRLKDHHAPRLVGGDLATAYLGVAAKGECEAIRVRPTLAHLTPPPSACAIAADRLAGPLDAAEVTAFDRILADEPRRAFGQPKTDFGLVAWAGDRAFYLHGGELRSAARADGAPRDEPAPSPPAARASPGARSRPTARASPSPTATWSASTRARHRRRWRVSPIQETPVSRPASSARRSCPWIDAAPCASERHGGDHAVIGSGCSRTSRPRRVRLRVPHPLRRWERAISLRTPPSSWVDRAKESRSTSAGGVLRASQVSPSGESRAPATMVPSPVRPGFDACERAAGGAIVASVNVP